MRAEEADEVDLAAVRIDEAVYLLDDRSRWQRPTVFGYLGEPASQVDFLRQEPLPGGSVCLALARKNGSTLRRQLNGRG